MSILQRERQCCRLLNLLNIERLVTKMIHIINFLAQARPMMQCISLVIFCVTHIKINLEL